MGQRGSKASKSGQDASAPEFQEIVDHELPPVLGSLVEEYERKIGHRDRFLVKWLHTVFPFFRLSSVEEANREVARTNKTLLAWYVTILDDIGEHENDEKTLSEAAKLPHPYETVNWDAPGVDRDYLDVAASFWEKFETRMQAAPRHDDVESQLRYDVRKTTQAIRYSMMVNEAPARASLREAELADSHNMMMLLLADVDIAYSSGFDLEELGIVRDLMHEVQLLARIGNWLTTWERELAEGDVSSGVFAHALEEGVLTAEELTDLPERPEARERVKTAIRRSRVEEDIQDDWQERYVTLRTDPPAITSIDVDDLLDGMSRLLTYQEACQTKK